MITTKSDRVTRDLNLLAPMATKGLVSVMVSVTSLDPKIAMTLEPRAPAPHKRLAAIKALSDAGIPVQVSISPLIPAITDHEIESISLNAQPMRVPVPRHSFPSGFPTKSHRSFANGSTRILPIAQQR